MCLSDGLFARRARESDFDAAPHMNHLGEILRLACSGQMQSVLRQDECPPVSARPAEAEVRSPAADLPTTAHTAHEWPAATLAPEDVT
jgi:hypothetical protein